MSDETIRQELLVSNLKLSSTFHRYYGYRLAQYAGMAVIVRAIASAALACLSVFFATKSGVLPNILSVPCMLVAILGAICICVWHVAGCGQSLRHFENQHTESGSVFIGLYVLRESVRVDGWNILLLHELTALTSRVTLLWCSEPAIDTDLFARMRAEVDKEIPAEA